MFSAVEKVAQYYEGYHELIQRNKAEAKALAKSESNQRSKDRREQFTPSSGAKKSSYPSFPILQLFPLLRIVSCLPFPGRRCNFGHPSFSIQKNLFFLRANLDLAAKTAGLIVAAPVIIPVVAVSYPVVLGVWLYGMRHGGGWH